MTRYALLIAADEYTSFWPTPFCHADARLLRDTLVNRCDYAEQDVENILLTPAEPRSPKELLQAIEALGARSAEGDTLLFYFAGHGDVHEAEPYLILPGTDPGRKEATALPLKDVTQRLRITGKVCVRVLDACHSGFDVRGQNDGIRPSDFARAIGSGRGAEGWMTLAACAAEEFSYPESGNGVFTRAFADSISERSSDTDIHLEAVKLDVCNRLARWSARSGLRQTPTFNSSISGNHAFATRRDPKVGATNEKQSPAIVEKGLSERLRTIRGLDAPGSEQQRKGIVGLFAGAREALEGCLTAFPRHYGVSCEIQSKYILSIPHEARGQVVETLRQKGLTSLHHVGTRVDDDYSPTPLATALALGSNWASGLLSEGRRPRTVDHYVELNGWPDTSALAEVTSDGICPAAQFWIYACPLRLRVALFVGFLIGGRPNAEVLLLDYGDAGRTAVTVSAAISRVWSAFLHQYDAAVTHAVESLEVELRAK